MSLEQISSFVGTTLLSLLLCQYLLPALCSEEDMDSEWKTWKRTFGVSYSETDENERRVIWETNLRIIEDHNENFYRGTRKFMMAMNKYGDLSRREYRRLQGSKINSRTRKRGKEVSARKLRAAGKKVKRVSVDYRTMGYVTHVKDQGFCGSCWAFSTTGAIEGQLYKETGRLVSLSEQNLVDCSRSYGTYGCSGAWMADAYEYVLNNGLQSERSYPYTAVDTQPCYYDSRQSVAQISDYRFIPAGDEQALADAVATIGPVTVALDADHPSFMFYSSGIYEEPHCNPDNLSHAVLLVGYGSEGGKDYWLIKNSWGTGWGENGYMRLIRNKKNACGIASYALYPVM
ncbi:cathepsin L1 [Megalops cyprinoides]|uniref:cathepsin L1 n=1 Tax=Megalops cyprinoides TaxID=118141 RepID=UPI0018643D2F|nr:cathepsin L1 [Megalops cyprinoides]